ncbi:MAG: YidC/Oxa1 family membrane protein insertase [Patescibacteria group bacterium]
MIYLYKAVLYNPLLNILIFLYNTVAFKDFGLAIIFLTVLIRIILYTIFHKTVRHQTIMQRLQPRLKRIQDEHKHDREKQTRAMLDLYKEHNINPFSGFLLLFAQLPILIALYQIFLNSLRPDFLSGLYGFISAPGALETSFLGLINLSEKSILMVSLAAMAQYFQAKLSLSSSRAGEKSPADRISEKTAFIGPIITIVIFYGLPAAVSLYWLVSSVFSVVQQIIINKQLSDGKLGNFSEKHS